MVVATEEEVAETTMLKIGMAADTINNLKNPRMNEALQRNYLTTQEQDLDQLADVVLCLHQKKEEPTTMARKVEQGFTQASR